MIFTQRYRELIFNEKGETIGGFCDEIEYRIKEKVANILIDFAEPQKFRPNRYDNYEETTDALESAIYRLEEEMGYPLFLRNQSYSGYFHSDIAARPISTLFDIIELQFDELSKNEKVEFQKEINQVLSDNELPWCLVDGRITKIDAKQFELDLKIKALSLMQELKDYEPKFKSAFEELMCACNNLEKGNYSETISYSEKCYESVLKVICNLQKGNADKLTTQYTELHSDGLPKTMAKEGFREKVLMSLPYIRNNSASDHGAGASTIQISKEMAKLALNMSASLCTYLIENYLNSLSIGQSSDNSNSGDIPF